MPEYDLLPPGRGFDAATPPRLTVVLTSARRRRRVRAGALGAVAGSGAIAALVLLAVPGGAADSLKTVTPAVSSTSSPSPHTDATSKQPVVMPGRPGGGGVRPAPGQIAPSAGPGAMTGPLATSGPRSGSQAAVTPHGGLVGPPHRTTAYDPGRACDGTGPSAATGWCSYYNGATSGRGGQPVVLATDVCRLPGQSAGVLKSDDGQQADFTVNERSAPSLWTWSHNRRFSRAGTSLAVPPGSCIEWYVSWNVVDDQGRALAAGSYNLAATPLASTGATKVDVVNPQTFTVNG